MNNYILSHSTDAAGNTVKHYRWSGEKPAVEHLPYQHVAPKNNNSLIVVVANTVFASKTMLLQHISTLLRDYGRNSEIGGTNLELLQDACKLSAIIGYKPTRIFAGDFYIVVTNGDDVQMVPLDVLITSIPGMSYTEHMKTIAA